MPPRQSDYIDAIPYAYENEVWIPTQTSPTYLSETYPEYVFINGVTIDPVECFNATDISVDVSDYL